jgi:hypothetical protein
LREGLISDFVPSQKGEAGLRDIHRRIDRLERVFNIVIGCMPGLLLVHEGLSDGG